MLGTLCIIFWDTFRSGKDNYYILVPDPTNSRYLKSCLGLASWYEKVVGTIFYNSASQENTRWLSKRLGKVTRSSSNILKNKLTTAPISTGPDIDSIFYLQVDASYAGLGASLIHKHKGREVVISYANRMLSDSEQKFTVAEKEILALVWAVKKFRPYLESYSNYSVSFCVKTLTFSVTCVHSYTSIVVILQQCTIFFLKVKYSVSIFLKCDLSLIKDYNRLTMQ